MDDPNTVMILFPNDRNAREPGAMMVKNPENAPFYIPSSPSSHTFELDDEDADGALPAGLRFTFDQRRRRRRGVIIGTAESCDIRFPLDDRLKGVSNFQCLIGFDNNNRLILEDIRDMAKDPRDQMGGQSHLMSGDIRGTGTAQVKKIKLDGTAVTYEDEKLEKRRNFAWILSGTNFTDGNQKICIYLHDKLCFRAAIPPRDHSSAEYLARVARFRQGAMGDPDQLLMPRLDLTQDGEATSAAPTGTQTPRNHPIWLNREHLGGGAYGTVTRVVNVSTGVECARKESLLKVDEEDLEFVWKREARLLRRISHKYIVGIVDADFSSPEHPILDLEFVPGKTLQYQDKKSQLSLSEVVMILSQGLEALEYLHNLRPPVAHRDIKPENILVQHCNAWGIHIKLADFGLSKDNEDLRTKCGTPLYQAPEIFSTKEYTLAVDIWSLGVMVYELGFGLPARLGKEGRAWCNAIVDKVFEDIMNVSNKSTRDLLKFLANHMLMMDPELRSPATQCRELVEEYVTELWV
ncbi:kinase-like domain-containing protein [Nemania sp. FL0916]|nr:kinase-like domain-containing protein [Nemania sp. FL0916]